MQDWELRVTHLIDHAAREHGRREIVTRWADGRETRSDWAGVRHDALRMTQALRRLGLGGSERVGTLALNHVNHLVTWYGAVGAGCVLHTINPRLFDDQLEYIVNHAEDRVLFYDAMFAPIVERLKVKWNVGHYICFDNGEFEAWLDAGDGDAQWAAGPEREPCMLCYTSGTTGNPKGVLYEHRSTVLHALFAPQAGGIRVEANAALLPIVPMFHAASWGLPWSGAAAGMKMVYCQANDPAQWCDLIAREKVTVAAGVPTVWLTLFQHLDGVGAPMPGLDQVITGGAKPPRSTVERFIRAGIRVAQAWGMTETSPIATLTGEPPGWDGWDIERRIDFKCRQGRVPFGVEIRCVSLDNPGQVLERDGKAAGALQVRGPWVIKRYFKAGADACGPDQWFDTGDVAVISPDGTLELTDRTKDVIKSGGEWISSVELENAAMAHEGVAEAAAIGIAHPKWDERPILVVVRKPGSGVTPEEIRDFLSARVARWWLPDAIEFVDELPHTGTGKVSKKDIRDLFAGYRLDN